MAVYLNGSVDALVNLCIDISDETVSYTVTVAPHGGLLKVYKIVEGSPETYATATLSEDGADSLIDWIYIEEEKESK